MGGQNSVISGNFEQDVANLPANNFTKPELKRLWNRFQLLSKGERFISKSILQQLPELQLNPLANRIADLFVDQNDKNSISFSSFVTQLSVFSFRANEEDKLHFLFRLYDKDRDGKINEEELYQVLKQIVGDNIEENQLRLLVKGTLEDADVDNDKALNYEEFKQSLERNPNIGEKLTVKF